MLDFVILYQHKNQQKKEGFLRNKTNEWKPDKIISQTNIFLKNIYSNY